MADQLEQPTDLELVRRALASDASAWSVLAGRYERALKFVARSRLGDEGWAEDVVQESLLCAWRWLKTYDSKYSFRTWLWTIVIHQCHRRATRNHKELARQQEAATRKENLTGAGPVGGGSPSELLERRETDEQLHRWLGQLPEKVGDALRLRFFGDLTFPEIAAAQGCGLTTAKARVREGLEQLSLWMRSPS